MSSVSGARRAATILLALKRLVGARIDRGADM
jgi:hypothetical protein